MRMEECEGERRRFKAEITQLFSIFDWENVLYTTEYIYTAKNDFGSRPFYSIYCTTTTTCALCSTT